MTLHLGRPDDEKKPLCGATDGSTISHANAGFLEQYAQLDGEYPCYACERIAASDAAPDPKKRTAKPKKPRRRSS